MTGWLPLIALLAGTPTTNVGTLGGSQTPREGAPLGKAQLRPTRIRYGRVIKPGPETHGFSVDVVEMRDCAGPHHVHPNGEIDLVMPLDGRAAFDGQGAGWKVYEAGSDHFPTVRGGRALVLYLLPGGAIQFTGRQPEAIG
jgi:hypothetical protein